MAPENSSITFRLAMPDDVVGMSDLRKVFIDPNQGVHRSCEPEYYRWKVFDNPLGPGIAYIAEADHIVVGMVTVSPRPMIVSKALFLAGELGDGFVHPDYQRRGIFNRLLSAILDHADKSGYNFTYGTPTAQAFSIEQKVGYQVVESLNLKSMARPLKLETFLSKRRHRSFSASLGKAGQSIYDLLWLNPSYQLSSIRKSSIIQTCYSLVNKCIWDQKFDVHANTTSEYLLWRYDTNPDRYDIYTLSHKQYGDGYYILKTGTSRGYHVGYIADYGYSGDKKMVRQIFLSALSSLKEKCVDTALIWANSTSGDLLSLTALGFIQVKSPFVIVRPGPKSPQDLLTPKRRFCMADSDNI